jgi:alpha-beta hydrolase superfamily lysophospholipase
MADTFTLATEDGARVVVHRWIPDGPVKAVVQIAHGLAEHAARYEHVAAALNDAGYAVYADDHRGHGESAATDDDLGYFADDHGWARVLDDLHRLTGAARAEHPELPCYLVGHSMGSFLSQQYLFTFPFDVDGVVLSGSNGPIGPLADVAAVVARAERRRLGSRGRSKLLDTLSFGSYNKPFAPNRTDFDWLSRDPEQVDRYVADPWCGFVSTTQLYLDLFSGLRVIQQVDRVRSARSGLPIYVFSGSEDPVGGQDGVDKLLAHYEAAGMTAVEHRVYEGGRHEMFNEIDREQVISDLIGWLDARVTATG